VSITAERCLVGQVNLRDERRVEGIESYWPEEAFQRIFLSNYRRLSSVLYRIVGDHARAEDLVIEAFWRLYRQPQVSDANGNPAGWLYRTATRLGIDSLRAAARRGRFEEEAGRRLNSQPGTDPLQDVLQAERRSQVRQALAGVRPEQAQLLILRASDFSYQELAEILNVTRGSVGTMLIRAEAAFRKSYLRLFGKEEEL
jgi:RNA polymerase sigma factor (sigma-70 family)